MADGRTSRDKSTYYFKDLTGIRFGNLVAIERAGKTEWGNVLWKCQCDCGKKRVVPSGKLLSHRVSNCGCRTSELKRKNAEKHGLTSYNIKPRTFIIWNGMKARCLNTKSISYKNYGGRGITICKEWMSFENFHNWAMQNGYSDDLQIDRIDNNGNYEPSNCRWVTREENSQNCSYNHFIEIMGIRKTVSEWLRLLEIPRSTAYKHLKISDEAFVSYAISKKGQVFFINKFLGGTA